MTVGIVGDDVTAVRSAVDAAGETTLVGSAAEVRAADPEFVVAVGERSLLAVARERPAMPILPVDAGPGVESVPHAAVEDAIANALAGDARSREHPLLSVSIDGDTCATAFADAMLVAAEPAQISEYRVETGDETVDQFRADGVVVATPAGSGGYARDADGPLVAPGVGLVVVPVAPFAIDQDHWVVDLDAPLTLTVAREESAVSLLADDREVGQVGMGEPVGIEATDAVTVVRTPESRPAFAAPDRE